MPHTNSSRLRVDKQSGAFTADWRSMADHWKDGWRDVVRKRALPADILAGLTVAAVALPLNLALAVASGVPPVAGLIAGAVGGFFAGAFGGSALQVTGPAAALSVLVLAIAERFGAVGVAAAALIAGLCQLALAFSRAGHLARHVPESVLAGFTTGVGLKLLDGQIPELLGFDYRVTEMAAMMHRPAWLHEVEWLAAVSGLFVAFLVVSTRHHKRFPAAIIGIGLITFIANYLGWNVTRVGEVPSTLPHPAIPLLHDDQWLDLILATIPIAFLASVESLLASSVVDRMAKADPNAPKEVHQPSLELFGQGIANIASGLMMGMPVSGVVVRSGVNLQSGGQTRLAAILHAVFLAGAVLYATDVLAHVPLAALAGLLCVVGFRLLEVATLRELYQHDKVEAVAFVITAIGTVSGHLMMGLAAGLLLHAANRFFFGRHESAERQQIAKEQAPGVRAVLGKERAQARQPGHSALPSKAEWMPNVRGNAIVPPTAYVHAQAALIGRVVLGQHVHIAAGASVRADEGSPFFIGDDSNIQDGVVIHALKQKRVVVGGEEWAVYVGRNVSMAHNALIHGPCYIGDDTFIGFKAVVHDAVIGKHCFIGIGAVVVGVEVPDGRFVPHGMIVDSLDQVEKLPLVDAAQMHFNEDVVDVNRGLAAAYRSLEVPRISPGAEGTARGSETPWSEHWGRKPSTQKF